MSVEIFDEPADIGEAINEFQIPIEFDGLYKLKFNKQGEVTAINFDYAGIAEKIKAELGIISFKEQVYVYHKGIYREGEEPVKKEIARIISGIKIAKIGGDSVTKANSETLYYLKFNDPCLEWPFNQRPQHDSGKQWNRKNRLRARGH